MLLSSSGILFPYLDMAFSCSHFSIMAVTTPLQFFIVDGVSTNIPWTIFIVPFSRIFVPGGVLTLSDGKWSSSIALHDVVPSVSSNSNIRGEVFDSWLHLGADKLWMRCICTMYPVDGTSSLDDFAKSVGKPPLLVSFISIWKSESFASKNT